jgi:DNA polymerase-3 subunit epsilon
MLPNWIRRPFDLARIKHPTYRFLFDPGPGDEVVSLDCETTGLNPRKDEIVTVAAVKIKGARILCSERFEARVRPLVKMNPEAIKIHGLRERDVATGRAMAEILPTLLRYVGGRPLVGYYLEFDVAMLNRYLRRWLAIELPNPRIEVSKLYYERKYSDAPPGTHVDLSFTAILRDLGLPMLDQHDAYADALMTAMIYVALRDLKARNVRISRQRRKVFGEYGAS